VITSGQFATRERLAQALASVEDAITLLEWRYDGEAETSIMRLQRLRDDLLVAHALLVVDEDRLH
jgi:hypothetical protein